MTTPRPTCREYRREMQLLAMQRRLAQPDLPAEEKRLLRIEVHKLERDLGMA